MSTNMGNDTDKFTNTNANVTILCLPTSSLDARTVSVHMPCIVNST